MMASYDWRVRHAGLMAIAAIGEGTGKVRAVLGSYPEVIDICVMQVLQNELGKIVEYVSFDWVVCYEDLTLFLFSMVTPMFSDSHPRVRYAACQCMCVDVLYTLINGYVLIQTSEDSYVPTSR